MDISCGSAICWACKRTTPCECLSKEFKETMIISLDQLRCLISRLSLILGKKWEVTAIGSAYGTLLGAGWGHSNGPLPSFRFDPCSAMNHQLRNQSTTLNTSLIPLKEPFLVARNSTHLLPTPFHTTLPPHLDILCRQPPHSATSRLSQLRYTNFRFGILAVNLPSVPICWS